MFLEAQFDTHAKNLPVAIWTALAERSGDSAFGSVMAAESGVALRLPPQSKT